MELQSRTSKRAKQYQICTSCYLIERSFLVFHCFSSTKHRKKHQLTLGTSFSKRHLKYTLFYFIIYDNFEIVVRNVLFVQIYSGTLWKNCNYASPGISNKWQQAVIKINWNCCWEKEMASSDQREICSLKVQLPLEPFFSDRSIFY